MTFIDPVMERELKFVPVEPVVSMHIGQRFSTWPEENDHYIMPCEVQIVSQNIIAPEFTVIVLDPLEKMNAMYVGKLFCFGHPGKIIANGKMVSYGAKSK